MSVTSVDYLQLANKPCTSGNSGLRTSVSDSRWCHPQALKMCSGGKWAPLRFQHYPYTAPPLLEHSLSVTTNRFFFFFLLSPFGATFVHLQKEFQQRGSRASEATQGCMFNAEQMWGDMRSRDAAGVSESLGELMSSAGKHRQLEHLSLLVLLPFLSFFFFFSQRECLMSRVVTGAVLFLHMMSRGHTEPWKAHSMGPWWSVDCEKAAHRRVLFISFKAAAPLWIIWAFPSWSHYLKRAGFALKSLVLHKAETVVWQCAPDRAPPGGGWSTGPRKTHLILWNI